MPKSTISYKICDLSCWEVVEKLLRSCWEVVEGEREREREAKTLPYATHFSLLWGFHREVFTESFSQRGFQVSLRGFHWEVFTEGFSQRGFHREGFTERFAFSETQLCIYLNIMNLSGIAEIIHHICKDRVGFIRICRCARKNLSGIADIMHHISIFRERKICAISFWYRTRGT